MRVNVDEAGREREPAQVNDLTATYVQAPAYAHDTVAIDCHISDDGAAAGAVLDGDAAQNEIRRAFT